MLNVGLQLEAVTAVGRTLSTWNLSEQGNQDCRVGAEESWSLPKCISDIPGLETQNWAARSA